ncbi:MAG: DNA pilot protein [Microvirus sp.]|nr:MAG: DNA pilot protein [Microvirus sp.]
MGERWGIDQAVGDGLQKAFDWGKTQVEAFSGSADYNAQVANLDWQKAAQQTTWDREDTAMQRKVNDLKAAGLNPVLAAGGAGSPTSAPIHTDAPQWGSNNLGHNAQVTANAISDVLIKKSSIAQTQAQTEATNAQARKTNAEADLVEKTNPANVDVVTQTAKSKIKQAMQDADLAALRTSAQDMDNQVKEATTGATNFEYQKYGKVGAEAGAFLNPNVKKYGDLQRSLLSTGLNLTESQIGAMAATIAASKLNASYLERLGVAPMLIQQILDVVKSLGPALAMALMGL